MAGWSLRRLAIVPFQGPTQGFAEDDFVAAQRRDRICLLPGLDLLRRPVNNLIGHTATREGLHIHAELDEGHCENGIKVSDAEFATINRKKDKFHGDWNYMIRPH